MVKTLFYSFGEIDVFNDFVIAIMKEGVTIIPEFNENLIDVSKIYFAGRPFGYITYRRNSYAVDPLVYLETSKIGNLVAFAVVYPTHQTINNVPLEKMFLKKPFRNFSNLDEAKTWIKGIILEYK